MIFFLYIISDLRRRGDLGHVAAFRIEPQIFFARPHGKQLAAVMEKCAQQPDVSRVMFAERKSGVDGAAEGSVRVVGTDGQMEEPA